MGQFIAGLFCIVVGLVVSLLIIGASAAVTVSTASLGYWIPAIIGGVLGLLIWSGGDLDFDFNPFD